MVKTPSACAKQSLRPRPNRSRYSMALAEEICARLVQGESLRSVCRDESMPALSTVFRWLAERRDFSALYARARDLQADVLAEDIVAISDAVKDKDEAAVAKVKLDARKWAASALRPRKEWEVEPQGTEDTSLEERLERAHKRLESLRKQQRAQSGGAGPEASE